MQAPAPMSKQQLQSFLRLLTYNAKFLSNLAHTVHLLYQLLRKNTKWAWKLKHEKSFSAAKQLLCQHSTLAHYDVNKQGRSARYGCYGFGRTTFQPLNDNLYSIRNFL